MTRYATTRIKLQDLLFHHEWREDATFRETVAEVLRIPADSIIRIKRINKFGTWDVTYKDNSSYDNNLDFDEDYQWDLGEKDDDYSPDDWDAHWR